MSHLNCGAVLFSKISYLKNNTLLFLRFCLRNYTYEMPEIVFKICSVNKA